MATGSSAESENIMLDVASLTIGLVLKLRGGSRNWHYSVGFSSHLVKVSPHLAKVSPRLAKVSPRWMKVPQHKQLRSLKVPRHNQLQNLRSGHFVQPYAQDTTINTTTTTIIITITLTVTI